MKRPRKPRIDGEGPSALQRLKDLPPEEHEFLLAQSKELTALRLIAQIEARHGITGLNEQRLSEFWRWLSERQEILAANESVKNIREIFEEVMPGAGAMETHKFLVRFLSARGFGEQDPKLLKFATIETRKSVEIEHEREKFEFDAAKAALKCLPQLRAIAADKSLDEQSRLQEARKKLFGVTPK